MLQAIFGKRKTPQEMLRENQRMLRRSIRDLERERTHLEQNEKKIIADIKKMAKQNQMQAVTVMAKDLVRTRQYIKKFILMKANIQNIDLKMTTLKSTDQMAQAMKGVTKAMVRMNKTMNLPQIQKIVMEFEKQSEMMDAKEEMMNDVMDDVMGDDDDEEETDKIVSQVFDELGLQMDEKMGDLDGPPIAQPAKGKAGPAAEPADGGADDDLMARLDALRRT